MEGRYDVVVVGGGVVGCAVLHQLTSSGYRCVLIEKNDHLVSEASSGNSGMLHTGFDATEETELKCIQYTQKHIHAFLEATGLPYSRIGATMVAWSAEQKSKLPVILRKCKLSGVNSTREISLSTLYQMEPYIRREAHGAIWIPEEAVVDPLLTAVSLAHQARRKSATILTDTLFEGCHYDDSYWTVSTNRGHLTARCIVNCGGLYGDIIDKIGCRQKFRIKPRKGQYIVYPQSGRHLINSSILPVPTARGKGIIVFKTVYDNVIVGPTAEETDIRSRPTIDDDVTMRLRTAAGSVVPRLPENRIVRLYTGVRPATETKDYHIDCDGTRPWVTAGGIRSTGLSGCLGIANMVEGFVRDTLYIEPSFSENWTLSRQTVVIETDSVAKIDGLEYKITHPITECKTRGVLSSL